MTNSATAINEVPGCRMQSGPGSTFNEGLDRTCTASLVSSQVPGILKTFNIWTAKDPEAHFGFRCPCPSACLRRASLELKMKSSVVLAAFAGHVIASLNCTLTAPLKTYCCPSFDSEVVKELPTGALVMTGCAVDDTDK